MLNFLVCQTLPHEQFGRHHIQQSLLLRPGQRRLRRFRIMIGNYSKYRVKFA